MTVQLWRRKTAPHAQDGEQKSNMWLHAQTERVKSINTFVCVCSCYIFRPCTHCVLNNCVSYRPFNTPAPLLLTYLPRSASALLPPFLSLSVFATTCLQGTFCSSFRAAQTQLSVETLYLEPENTASARAANYDFIQSMRLNIWSF